MFVEFKEYPGGKLVNVNVDHVVLIYAADAESDAQVFQTVLELTSQDAMCVEGSPSEVRRQLNITVGR